MKEISQRYRLQAQRIIERRGFRASNDIVEMIRRYDALVTWRESLLPTLHHLATQILRQHMIYDSKLSECNLEPDLCSEQLALLPPEASHAILHEDVVNKVYRQLEYVFRVRRLMEVRYRLGRLKGIGEGAYEVEMESRRPPIGYETHPCCGLDIGKKWKPRPVIYEFGIIQGTSNTLVRGLPKGPRRLNPLLNAISPEEYPLFYLTRGVLVRATVYSPTCRQWHRPQRIGGEINVLSMDGGYILAAWPEEEMEKERKSPIDRESEIELQQLPTDEQKQEANERLLEEAELRWITRLVRFLLWWQSL